MDIEKVIAHVNDIVAEAIIHGGDAGGSYDCNEEDLVASMNDLIELLDVSDSYEVRDEYGLRIAKKTDKTDIL